MDTGTYLFDHFIFIINTTITKIGEESLFTDATLFFDLQLLFTSDRNITQNVPLKKKLQDLGEYQSQIKLYRQRLYHQMIPIRNLTNI